MAREMTIEEMLRETVSGELERERFGRILGSAKEAGATHVVLWRIMDDGWTKQNSLCIYKSEDPIKKAEEYDDGAHQVVIVPL